MSWRRCKLGDVITLKRGYDLPEQRRITEDVPIVSSSGITGYHNEAKVKAPGVVTGRYGTLGEVFYLEEDFWPLNTALYVQDFKGNHPHFVAYFLKVANLNMQRSAGAVPGVNRNILHDMEVSLPDLATQRRIASLLSDYDDLIENNLRRIALLEESARLLYREWFVRLRFPGHEHTRIVDGVPEGWEKVKLGGLAEINRETLPSSYRGQIEYVDISAVTPGRINETTIYEFADAPGRARRVVRHGDIIWSCVRPNRRSHAVIWQPPPNLIASTGFAVITPAKLPTSFLYAAVTTDTFVGYLENHAHGAAYPAVLARDFENADITVPSPQLVKAYNEFAEPNLAQIQNLRLQNQKLKLARDLLLPRLMRGEIAV